MANVTFFLRAEMLYCRVTLNRTTAEFSTKQKVLKTEWNQQTQQFVGKNKQKKELVEMLVNATTYKIKTKSVAQSFVTASELVQSITDKKTLNTLSEIIRQYIGHCEDKATTKRNHEIKLKNLLEFEKHTKTNYFAETFTIKTATTFVDWFQKRAKTTNKTTAYRNVLFYKMCLKWYRKQGNKVQSELFMFDGEKDKIKPTIFLSAEELKTIQGTTFLNPYLSRIRDLFLFQCYTGLSYCDLWSNWELKTEKFGKILVGERGKNGQKFWIPIETPIVEEILNRYNNQLPHYENAPYNRIIKEIVAICGINKKVTTHTARKTFATQMDSNGWSRETVAKMLGHKSIKTTEIYYLGETFARLETEMQQRLIS
jgi:integrase